MLNNMPKIIKVSGKVIRSKVVLKVFEKNIIKCITISGTFECVTTKGIMVMYKLLFIFILLELDMMMQKLFVFLAQVFINIQNM